MAHRLRRAVPGFVALAMTVSVGVATPAKAAPIRDDPGTGPARQSIERLAPHLADRFVLRHEQPAADGHDRFTVAPDRGHIELDASTNATLVSAFAWYLENVAHGQIARGPDHIPASAPLPQSASTHETPFTWRYINNFTVSGYTTPNWTWPEWQAELDQLAAHGVNMALVTVGQEAAWYETFQDFGYTADEVRNWIVPPAHQPWQWLGNMQATNSGVTASLIERRAALGRKIIARMRELGITPVVPGLQRDRAARVRRPEPRRQRHSAR